MKKAFKVVSKNAIHDWEEIDQIYSSCKEAKKGVKELNSLSKKFHWEIQYKVLRGEF